MKAERVDYVRKVLSCVFAVLFTAVSVIWASEAKAESKRAFKMLEKGEYDKLVELLQKSIEKDSVNAGAKYVFSLLYLTPKYNEYNIDTAYYFINGAIADFGISDEKAIENLVKLDINDSTLLVQKREVEEQAFRRAKAKNTIADYNYFLNTFNKAVQTDSVISFRNEIAYNDAVQADTYEAFQYFMHTYPDAVQYENAHAKYEELLYRTNTRDKRLESYIRFLKNNPKTPYRLDAERNIFEISTADNDPDSYMTFIERYPNSQMKRKALDMLYHCFKNHYSAEGFENRFNILQQQDSLAEIVSADAGCLFPIFEMDKYGFSKLDGEKLIDFKYDKIKTSYYCGNITEDFLEVELGETPMIVSRLGGVIFEGQYINCEDLGSGVLKIEKEGYVGVYHKSGYPILDFNYEDAAMVADAFIKYKYRGKWGLKSLMSREILPPEYDDIFSEGRFVLLEKNGLYSVQNVESLSKTVNMQTPGIEFKYDDYELIYASQMLLFEGDLETVIDLDLKENVKPDKQNFYELYDGWMIKKNDKYRIYDAIFYPLSDLEFEKVEYNKSRAALKYQGKWGIYNAFTPFPETFNYDSVHLLSEQIGIIVEGDKMFAIFDNDSLIDISYSEETRLLKPTGIALDENNKYSQYLLTKTAKGVYKVFDIDGVKIIDGKFSSIQALGREYILVERSGKKGLYHNSGNLALKLSYAAIGNYHDGYVSTLISGKFGIYNHDKNVFLSTKYQKALVPFGSFYFIGTKGDMFGLVDLDNKEVSGFKFEKILDWNDSVALVKTAEEWKLYDIKNDAYVYEGISEYSVLREDEDERILLITKEGKNGILSNKYGEVVSATFNDIINIGTAETPVYFAEKFVFEADFFVIIYYNAKGKILRKQIFTDEEEYEKIYCG